MGAKKLTPPEKAATVLLALGEDGAAAILRDMSEQDRLRALRALSRLGKVDQETADAALKEFREDMSRGQRGLDGARNLARKLLSQALPQFDPGFFDDEVEGGTAELEEVLRDLEPKVLVNFLAKEEAPLIALVLAHLDSGRGAACLKLLPERLRLPALERLARIGTVDPSVLKDLTETLRDLGQQSVQQGTAVKGGVEKLLAIVNALDPAASQDLLAALGERDRHLADTVVDLLFQFRDLARLPDKSLVEIIKSVPMETLKLALKKAPEPVTEALFRNLSARAQSMLRDDIAAMGLVRLSDVEKAQKQLADTARRMIDEGKIAGPKDRGDYV